MTGPTPPGAGQGLGGGPEPPAEIAELATACARFVRDALELELDYSPDTLPILDHYLSERARAAEPEVKHLLAPAAGAYFGELVRRQLGGARWYCPPGEHARFRLEFAPFFLCFNPVGVALEAIEQADAAGFGAHFQVLDEAREAVDHALSVIDDVRGEDYYRLSVRYEALLQVVSALDRLEQRQQSPRIFGAEVYRTALGEGGGSETSS